MKPNFNAFPAPVTRLVINGLFIKGNGLNYFNSPMHEIGDMTEITMYCDTDEDVKQVAALFPKYCYKLSRCNHAISFNIDIIHTDKVTGDANETAMKRRNKVLEILATHNFFES